MIAAQGLKKPGSTTNEVSWNFLWGAPVANKIKIFAWMACREALPLAVNLVGKGLNVVAGCAFCGDEKEDLRHVLCECHFAQMTWALSNLPWSVISSWRADPLRWFSDIHRRLSRMDFGFFLTLAWSLWFSRNKKCMEQVDLSPLDTVTTARNFHAAFTAAQDMGVVDRRLCNTPATAVWTRPPEGMIKLNFDGAVFAAARAMGIGVVARDNKGHCQGWLSKYLDSPGDALVAETRAAMEAISLARQKGWNNVIIEGDTQLVINALRRRDRDLSVVGHLIDDIRRRSDLLPSVCFQFVRRDGNRLAHMLARRASPHASVPVSFPEELQQALQADV